MFVNCVTTPQVSLVSSGDKASEFLPVDGTIEGLAGDWQADLPQSWPDRPGNLFRFLWALAKAPITRSGAVEIPDDLPGRRVPKYARQRFHGMPNGYYSARVADGYDKGFELSMLGRVRGARARMTDALCGPAAAEGFAANPVGRALDVGCGSGRLCGELVARGVPEVWGLDPSPYMLRQAQRRSPGARFAQGIAEDTAFPQEYFDAVGACFLFHELPAYIARKALRETRRILRPGGTVCITEPCRIHTRPRSVWSLLRQHGPSAVYFHVLSRAVHEPFVNSWLDIEDHARWLGDEGFELIQSEIRVPFLQLVARKMT
jgi:ubiquinone/menaquinone biosynthesis C-methylase UbiE